MTILANSLKRVPRVSENPPCFPRKEKAWHGAPPTNKSTLPLKGLASKLCTSVCHCSSLME